MPLSIIENKGVTFVLDLIKCQRHLKETSKLFSIFFFKEISPNVAASSMTGTFLILRNVCQLRHTHTLSISFSLSLSLTLTHTRTHILSLKEAL